MMSFGEACLRVKYHVITDLGQGGMGEVRLALERGGNGFQRLVALKLVRSELSEIPYFLAMFYEEARLAARLNHPNIVQTYEVGAADNRHFIAMEYLEGQPLYNIRSRVGLQLFPLALHLRILTEVLAGLHHAHTLTDFDGTPLRIVHRDVTPQNVVVTYDGQVKVVDFGVAKAGTSMRSTEPGALKGKLKYMAPEQTQGRSVDHRADVFSVGVMLWEALAGERMWEGLDEDIVLMYLSAGQVPDLPSIVRETEPELARICLQALAPEACWRTSSAAELQHALERWLERYGEAASTRAVGAFVAEHFEEERLCRKAVVERDVRESFSSVDELEATIPVSPPRERTLTEMPTTRMTRPSPMTLDAPTRRSCVPRPAEERAYGGIFQETGAFLLSVRKSPVPSAWTPMPVPLLSPVSPPTPPSSRSSSSGVSAPRASTSRPRPLSPARRPAPPVRRRFRLVASLIGAATLAVVLGLVWDMRRAGPELEAHGSAPPIAGAEHKPAR